MTHKVADEYRLLIADVYELAGLSRTVSDREAKALDATAAQWHILSVLAESSATVSEVARRLGLPRQAVHRVSGDMIKRGLLTRTAQGARTVLLTCTETGHRHREELFRASEARIASVLGDAKVTKADLQQARATVRKLLHATRSNGDARSPEIN